VLIGEWIPYGTTINYSPKQMFFGNDTIEYFLTDNMANSTTARVLFVINPVQYLPIPVNKTAITTVGYTIDIELMATDLDTTFQDLKFYRLSDPIFGYASIEENSNVMKYQAINPGFEFILWQVSDGTSMETGHVEILVGKEIYDYVLHPFYFLEQNKNDSSKQPLESSEVAGVVVGSILALTILAVIIAYFVYWYIAAKRFEKTVIHQFISNF
jgi:hypothetical protein